MSKTVLESVDSTDLDVENPMLRFDEVTPNIYHITSKGIQTIFDFSFSLV